MMRKGSVIFIALCLSLALFAAGTHAQQDKSARPSAPAKASFDLGGGKSITVDYSSPRVKARKIYGELVPFGKVWRAGANEATTLVTTADIVVGGTPVPVGTYTLFAIPNKDKWTLIISKATGEWGTDYPGPDKDLARVDMKVSTLPSPVENFTISFDKSGPSSTMNIDWETTRASVTIAQK